ncbi:MAG: twin-arginine translocase TatA/TatE family subunit [Akkermansia sp.]|nr:twin-arginine translocase TatA/TatE family subunit [Akkermansia sp.]
MELTPVLAQFGSPSQWLIFLAVVLVVFGARRLPEIARNLGRSLGEFKKARKEFEEELRKAESDSSPQKKDKDSD